MTNCAVTVTVDVVTNKLQNTKIKPKDQQTTGSKLRRFENAHDYLM